MITLRANPELKKTFEKLIHTMKVPVKWDGLFVIVDNYMILLGEIRSLFFHFDSRKVITNIIDLTIKEETIQETGENPYVRNVINMILYAFGKWGTIRGLKVEKNYNELNRLFSGIMKDIGIEPDYTKDSFCFYQKGIKITYEDVMQAALEAKESLPEIPEERAQGLWHKLIWKRMLRSIEAEDTTVAERRKNRIGNNFYLTGYQCPFCKKKLHMVVYPDGKEFQVETDEGGVILARAYTCEPCCCFYTPRPEKLLAEGDLYVMDFEGDRVAYQDYQELLGKNGARVSNYNYNRYVNQSKNQCSSAPADDEQSTEEPDGRGAQAQEAALDARMRSGRMRGFDFGGLSDRLFRRFTFKIEEGFYPDENVEKVEETVQKEKRVRKEKREKAENREREHSGEKSENLREAKEQNRTEYGKMTGGGTERSAENERSEHHTDGRRKDPAVTVRSEKEKQKYHTRIRQFSRLSERQKKELQNQICQDKNLDDAEKKQLMKELREEGQRETLAQIRKKAEVCQDKSYAVIQKVYEEAEQADLPVEEKKVLIGKLDKLRKTRGEQEVRQLAQQMPEGLDRKGYQDYLKKMRSYEGVDTAQYEEKIKAGKEAAEAQEIASMVRRARKISRGDFLELLDRLDQEDFSPELAAPYREKILEKIRAIDQEAIDGLMEDVPQMTFEDAEKIYQTIEEGPFLPELKADALETIGQRLAKIKTDECELLVQKLKNEMKEEGLSDCPKHHFYPAKKVLLKQAEQSETDVIDYALASYGAERGTFEYPIFVVDTTHNGRGDKGMFLTPEQLYYSTLMTSYRMSVFSIDRIEASSGLLNRGLYVYQKNGKKTKIPYAVDATQLTKLAAVLDRFVKYLQEKPFSRKETYLVKEQHDTICCYRCGYVYRGSDTCPKCGYKMNI